MEKKLAILEGYLFLCGDDGAEIKDLKHLFDEDNDSELNELIDELISRYKSREDSGLMIQKFAKTKIRMIAKDVFFEYYLKLENIKTEAKLSSAAIEVLSLIAYRGPISRPSVESIRGVNCETLFQKLRQRNLITEVGKSDEAGKPMLFATTDDFLKYFNLNSLDDLPPIEQNDKESDNLF